ncbi:unnamed protein product, partial [Rotaria sp. Silwood2]
MMNDAFIPWLILLLYIRPFVGMTTTTTTRTIT